MDCNRGRPKLTEDFDGNTKKASIEAFKAGNENVSSEIEHHHVPVYRQLIDSRKSAEDTANVIGSSRAKVERARKVLRDPIKKEEVLSGEKTIHKAYTEIKEEEKVISKGTCSLQGGEGWIATAAAWFCDIPGPDVQNITEPVRVAT